MKEALKAAETSGLPTDPGKNFQFERHYTAAPRQLGPISLYQFGELSCEAGYEIAAHRQWCQEISYVVSGGGHFIDNAQAIPVKEGDLIFNPAGHTHAISADCGEAIRFAYLGFELAPLEMPLEEDLLPLRLFYQRSGCLHAAGCQEIFQPFRKGLEEFYLMEPAHLLMAQAYLLQILLLSYRALSGALSSAAPSRAAPPCGDSPPAGLAGGVAVGKAVYAAIRYIDRHLLEIQNVQQLSLTLGYNRTYLSHLFKSRMNRTLEEYLTQQKMERAKELLLRDHLSIAKTAELLQYASASAFSRAFRSYAGVPPSAFIKQGQR